MFENALLKYLEKVLKENKKKHEAFGFWSFLVGDAKHLVSPFGLTFLSLVIFLKNICQDILIFFIKILKNVEKFPFQN